MALASRDLYIAAQLLLGDMGIIPTDDRMNLFVAWEIAEHGWHGTLDCHNPMNTTLRRPGSTTINSAGVQCYSTWDEGIRANIDTLQHGYPTLLEAVKEGDLALFVSARYEWMEWSGQNPAYGGNIQSIFSNLSPVPTEYMTRMESTPTGAVPIGHAPPTGGGGQWISPIPGNVGKDLTQLVQACITLEGILAALISALLT